MLIAANLHNSVALIPHYSLQLLALLAARPPGSAFLSIYESGSSDATGALSIYVGPDFSPFPPLCLSARRSANLSTIMLKCHSRKVSKPETIQQRAQELTHTV